MKEGGRLRNDVSQVELYTCQFERPNNLLP